MTQVFSADFPALLRRRRFELGLSQEALAERAGISTDAVSRYERGLRLAPRRETIALLAAALDLSGKAQTEFENAAKRKYGALGSTAVEPRQNLPWQPTSFVGRRDEIPRILALLKPRRLLTITGAGGIGKTRTAIEVAQLLLRRPAEGIWFLDLAPLSDEALVLAKLASVLRLSPSTQLDPLAGVIEAVGNREALVILDNCEHVLNAVRTVAAALLRDCPNITLLATSRERLKIAGEMAYPLSVLAAPPRGSAAKADGQSYDAVELFLDRVGIMARDILPSDEHMEAAADICRRLDGIALAIELAAARVPALGMLELRTQLAKHFKVLGNRANDVQARQQTLDATIAWSYGLLNESERVLFRRLAAFSGGWTLAAAVAACTDAALSEELLVGNLISLVEKSLVVADVDAVPPRYSLFESTRSYALERLQESGEFAEASRAQATWIADYADAAYAQYGITPRLNWELAMMPELENALVAIEWSLGPHGNALLAGRLASSLQAFWRTAGIGADGHRYVDAAIARIDPRDHPGLVARLLLVEFQFLRGGKAQETIERAIALLAKVDDRWTLAKCHIAFASLLARSGKYEEAEKASDEALALLDQLQLQRSSVYAGVLSQRSSAFLWQGRLSDAKTAVVAAHALAQDLADDWMVSLCQSQIAEIEFSAGDARLAVEFGLEALSTVRRVRVVTHEVNALCNLACYQFVLGDVDQAEANARAALDLVRTSKVDVVSMHLSIQHIATAAALHGRPKRAARLIGNVNEWHARTGYRRNPTSQKSFEVLMESLRDQLSESELLAFGSEGAALSDDAIIDEALA